MQWTKFDSDLRDLLAGLFPEIDDAKRIVEDAGMRSTQISFKDKPVNNWQGIIRESKKHQKTQAIIESALLDYPENEQLRLASQGQFNPVRGPEIDSIDWQADEDANWYEKVLGDQPTFLPIAFLEKGLALSKSVCRITREDGNRGTGFLIDNNCIVTNHHVLGTVGQASQAKLQFNYQKTIQGGDAPFVECSLEPQKAFRTNDATDLTVVGVQGEANAEWGKIDIVDATVKKGDRVSIIQHPGGGGKHIAMHHNLVVFNGFDENRKLQIVQYLTDTDNGSSGSPVFDARWNLVAIHHSGGYLREPGSQRRFFRNEGIAVSALAEMLSSFSKQ